MDPTTGKPPDDDDPHVAALLAVWQHRGRDAPPPPCPVCGAWAVEDAAGRLSTTHDPAKHGVGQPAFELPIRTPTDAALAAVRRATGERDDHE